MRRFIVIFAMVLLGAAFTVSATAYPDEAELASGYIVTLVENTSDITSGGCLFSESGIPDDLEGEELAQFVSQNVDNTKDLIPEIGMMKVEDEETLNLLIDLGLVAEYEPNIKMYLHGYDYTENPVYSYQWGHAYINSSYAWDAGIFGNNVRVAVIDSGVYPNKDIVNNLAQGYNYLDKNTDTTDNLGHGTFVAGIIAAQCNNLTTVGLAHRATIVPLKVAKADGKVDMDLAILAMKDAVDTYNCDVLNMSLGTTDDSTALRNAVNHVLLKGAIIVASAGNDGNDSYKYPASYDGVVSVGNVERSGSTLIIRSSSQHNDKVNIAAPGTSVYSLANRESGFRTYTGTSFSAPYVSAAAALVKSINKNVDGASFQYVLKKTANKSYITSTQGSTYWGAGLLDVKALIEAVLPSDSVTDGFYISGVDTQIYGEGSSIYFTNLTDAAKNFGTAIVYSHSTGEGFVNRLNGVKTFPVVLEADSSIEIPLAGHGFSGDVSVVLIDSNLSPQMEKRTYTLES